MMCIKSDKPWGPAPDDLLRGDDQVKDDLEDILDGEIQDIISKTAWLDGYTGASGNPRSEPYYTIRQENFENLEIAIRELVIKYWRKAKGVVK